MACQSLDNQPHVIYQPKTGKYLTLTQFVEQVRSVPLLLLGEQHDDIRHRQAQVALLNALMQTGKRPTVVLEMLPSTQQSEINAALHQIRRAPIIDGATVKQYMPWSEGWQWSQYGILLTAISRFPLSLRGGNLDRQEIETLWQGAYPLDGFMSTAPPVKQRIAQAIAFSHRLPIDDPHIATLVAIQQFKDRRMAETLIRSGSNTLLIAGNVHVSKTVGVPLHLADLGQHHWAVISFAKHIDELSITDADYLWLIP